MDWLMDLDIQRFLRQSAEERKQFLDRWLQDFSLAFKGHPDGDIPPLYAKEYFAMLKKQQEEQEEINEGTLNLNASGAVVVKDPETGTVWLRNQQGTVGIAKQDIPALVQFLQTPKPSQSPPTGETTIQVSKLALYGANRANTAGRRREKSMFESSKNSWYICSKQIPRRKNSTVVQKLPQVGNGRTPDQREQAKADFLNAYASCMIVYRACEQAKINTATIRYWLDSGFLQQSEIDAAADKYRDRIRGVLHDLAIEGTNKPLNYGHGHILTDANGNPLVQNTKDVKVLLAMAKRHLPEYHEEPYQTGTVNINIGAIPTNNLYYMGIDLKGWQLEDIAALKEIVQRGESRKLILEEENTVNAL